MAVQLPEHVIADWGSARNFREDKRRLVREMAQTLDELRVGCAYFPNGSRGVENIMYELEILKRELSIKSWGR